MRDLYSKPLRVYIILIALGVLGIISGLKLPISLFPMSAQPLLAVNVGYGSLAPQQFYESMGKEFEGKLKAIKVDGISVDLLTAEYNDKGVLYKAKFGWGTKPEEAKKAVDSVATSFFSSREIQIRRSVSVDIWNQNQGFFAMSFSSSTRSLDELYDLLNPLIADLKSKVDDADRLGLFNPAQKEISIKLSPEKLALYGIKTSSVENHIRDAVTALNGGTVKIGEQDLQINISRSAENVESLSFIRVSELSEIPVLLKDVADLSVIVSKENEERFRSDGEESLIFFASPKQGGNIKSMGDAIVTEMSKIQNQFPKDVHYKILVNPSEFIDKSILGVMREVGLAAFLAVVVLFFFIGSLKNVATAAVEIPLSLILAFILMKLTGMNLNLISLGGLALSAGMNVDASVVVLENIFRHFENQPESLSPQKRLDIIVGAVNEVKLPIIASTIASLVVFMPLVFTRGLTDAILGDLAKAVIFSHGLSAIVALILVPTIRYQLLKKGNIKISHSPIEKHLLKFEDFYEKSLARFLGSFRAQALVALVVLLSLPLLILVVIPKLDKEVVGRPETEWINIGISAPLSNSIKEVESHIITLEDDLRTRYGKKITSMFSQINSAQNGFIMVRWDSRNEASANLPLLEEIYKDTPTLYYWVEAWNPSELSIPNPPDWRVDIVGGSEKNRFELAENLLTKLRETSDFSFRSEPSVQRRQFISIEPLGPYMSEAPILSQLDISHYLRTASAGIMVEEITDSSKSLPIYLRIDSDRTSTIEQLKALPIGYQGRLIPISAIAKFKIENGLNEIYRENLVTLFSLRGRATQLQKKDLESYLQKADDVVTKQSKSLSDSKLKASEKPSLHMVEPQVELEESLGQLKIAVLISILLVFLVMVIQLGSIIQASLVMVAIPFGLIGAIFSLFLFQSTLSLNSGLGTILLNGIAVANSIILVDFIQKLYSQGKSALEATTYAAKARLRPIIMTSLTTILGMLPIALGMGEGGKILQPLGIAVCGGLWVSVILTLFVVPTLQYRYLLHLDIKRWNAGERNRSIVEVENRPRDMEHEL